MHFAFHGVWEGRKPFPRFSKSFYLKSNPDVATLGSQPLLHYLLYGFFENRQINKPLHSENCKAQIENRIDQDLIEKQILVILDSGLFNRDYYIAMNEDVDFTSIDPVRHYCTYGWRELRDPSPDFDTAGYFEAYQDIYLGGINPLWHYIEWGKLEGRKAVPEINSRSEDNVRFAIGKSDLNLVWYFPRIVENKHKIYNFFSFMFLRLIKKPHNNIILALKNIYITRKITVLKFHDL
jgi:hypothetical protein